LLSTAAVALLGLLVGYLVTVLAIFPPQRMASGLTEVPDLVGLTADEARRRAERSGLTYEETDGFHHEMPTGTVVAQEPLAGQRAGPGSPVRVTLSLGARTRPVPDVVGLSETQARAVMQRAGFVSDVIRVDADAAVGQVVDTHPDPGTVLETPGNVRLIVSAGPSRVRVPELLTLSVDEVSEALNRMGLRLGEVSEDTASLAAPGTVLRQSPEPGTEVARGAVVSVTVAITPPQVEPADTLLQPADTINQLSDTTAVSAAATEGNEDVDGPR
jgi:serine/threonine-protein kinase